jgi:hypothetical protein
MSAESDANEVNTGIIALGKNVADVLERYSDLLPADALHQLQGVRGEAAALSRLFVGYLDEWDHFTYHSMVRRGWIER